MIRAGLIAAPHLLDGEDDARERRIEGGRKAGGGTGEGQAARPAHSAEAPGLWYQRGADLHGRSLATDRGSCGEADNGEYDFAEDRSQGKTRQGVFVVAKVARGSTLGNPAPCEPAKQRSAMKAQKMKPAGVTRSGRNRRQPSSPLRKAKANCALLQIAAKQAPTRPAAREPSQKTSLRLHKRGETIIARERRIMRLRDPGCISTPVRPFLGTGCAVKIAGARGVSGSLFEDAP